MTDFVSQLESDLVAAAQRLTGPRSPPGGRGRYRRALLVAVLVLIVATPALAGIPGVWGGLIGSARHPSSPSVTTRPPDPRILALIGVFRRPAGPRDNSPAAAAAVRAVGPLDGVSIDVRYVGLSPIGDPMFLLAYRSGVRLLESGNPVPSRRYPKQRAQYLKNQLPYALQPGVCLVALASDTPEIHTCLPLSSIQDGHNYGVTGVYRTRPIAKAPAIDSPSFRGVIATEASSIVPDGIATVTLIFPNTRPLELKITNNYFALLNPPNRPDPTSIRGIPMPSMPQLPTIIWRDPNANVIRQIRP